MNIPNPTLLLLALLLVQSCSSGGIPKREIASKAIAPHLSGCSDSMASLAGVQKFVDIFSQLTEKVELSKSQSRYLRHLMEWLDGGQILVGASFDYLDEVAPLIKHFPELERDAFIKKLLARYSSFDKNPKESLPQKRLADVLLNLLADNGTKMHKEVLAGGDPRKVYEKFLDQQRSLLEGQDSFGK